MHLHQELGSTYVVPQCVSPEQIRVCSRALCRSLGTLLGNPSTKLSVKGKTSILEKLLNFQFGLDFVNTRLAFNFLFCIISHKGRVPHIYCRGINVDKVQLQPPTCPVPPASPLPLPISPVPPLPPASPVPPASSLPPVLHLVPALPLALVSPLVILVPHRTQLHDPVKDLLEEKAGITQQELVPWRGHSHQPHVAGLQLLRSSIRCNINFLKVRNS